MFDRLRKWNGQINSYPPSLGDYKIDHVRDLTTGYDSREADFNAVSLSPIFKVLVFRQGFPESSRLSEFFSSPKKHQSPFQIIFNNFKMI